MAFEYKPRLIDEEIDEYLEMIGAILIEGPNGAVRQQQQNSMQKVALNYRTRPIRKTI